MTYQSSTGSTRDDAHRSAFFRHGGWLMITTVTSGMFSWGVHFLSKKVHVNDWGTFVTLLAVLNCIPAIPLQMVLAQQTAAALAAGRRRQLAGMIRITWFGTFALCAAAAVVLWFFQQQLMIQWKMTTPAPLWITLAAVLLTFWMPMFFGIMQGQQNFFWLGWGFILNGFGRLACATAIVLAVGGVFVAFDALPKPAQQAIQSHAPDFKTISITPAGSEEAPRYQVEFVEPDKYPIMVVAADGEVLQSGGEPPERGPAVAGLMVGVVIGLTLTVGLGVWQTRALWMGPSEAFAWKPWLGQVLPLLLGFASGQFLFSADMMFVKSYFAEDQATFYGAAGTLSRALVWFVGPLTAVMFPKIVHSTVRSEKTNLMGLTLASTAALLVLGVGGLWLLGPFAVRMVYRPEFVEVTTSVLPWYAAAMIPYCLANVLLNNLLARSDFRIVAMIVPLAFAYGVTLAFYHPTLISVLQMVGLFNLGLLGACSWFTWGAKRRGSPATPSLS